MALAYRAPRAAVFNGRSDTPGPGAHDVNRPRPISASYVGFSSTSKRPSQAKPNADKTPGPGTSINMGSAFNSTSLKRGTNLHSGSSRIAPNFPGSTVYQASSVKDNPGPGAYQVRGEVPGLKRQESTHTGALLGGRQQSASQLILETAPGHPQQTRDTTSNIEVPSTASHNNKDNYNIGKMIRKNYTPVPTIPARAQSHGYEVLSQGKLLPQSAPVEEYTGIGSDTVGPAMYNTSNAAVEARAPSVNFNRASTRKSIFGSSSEGPSPFAYNVAGPRFQDKSSRGTAAFESRVPMAHERGTNAYTETPAPGEYSLPSTIQSGKISESTDNIGGARNQAQLNRVERFGSTENRSGGWDRSIFAPYTNKKAQGPGPGTVSSVFCVS